MRDLFSFSPVFLTAFAYSLTFVYGEDTAGGSLAPGHFCNISPGLSWIWFAVSVWMILSVGWKLEKCIGKGFVFSYIVLVWLITVLSDFVIYIVFHKVFWLNMSFCGFSFLLLAVLLIPQEKFRLFTCIELNAKWLTILLVFILLLRSILKITVPEYLTVVTCLISAGIIVAVKRRRNIMKEDKT